VHANHRAAVSNKEAPQQSKLHKINGDALHGKLCPGSRLPRKRFPAAALEKQQTKALIDCGLDTPLGIRTGKRACSREEFWLLAKSPVRVLTLDL
jgi:hypothetical protein